MSQDWLQITAWYNLFWSTINLRYSLPLYFLGIISSTVESFNRLIACLSFDFASVPCDCSDVKERIDSVRSQCENNECASAKMPFDPIAFKSAFRIRNVATAALMRLNRIHTSVTHVLNSMFPLLLHLMYTMIPLTQTIFIVCVLATLLFGIWQATDCFVLKFISMFGANDVKWVWFSNM